jgi:hypothetical protein
MNTDTSLTTFRHDLVIVDSFPPKPGDWRKFMRASYLLTLALLLLPLSSIAASNCPQAVPAGMRPCPACAPKSLPAA